jgi:hypothetical protein
MNGDSGIFGDPQSWRVPRCRRGRRSSYIDYDDHFTINMVALESAPFWLCRLLEGAFQANASLIFSGDAFDEGYNLIKIQWLEFVNVDSANQRCYRLGEEGMLSVHSLVRFRAVKILETSADASRGRSRTK